jgi:exonuclease SbcC
MRKELDSKVKELKKKEKDLTGLKKEEQQYMRAEVEIEEIKKRKRIAEEKIIESKGELKKLDERRKEVDILEKDIEKLEFDPSVYEKVKKELDHKSQIEREMIKLDERISKKAEVTQSIAETEKKLLNQQKKIKTVRANLEEVKDVPEKFTKVKNKKDKINEEEIKISREYTEKKTQYSERAKEIQKLQTLKGTLKDMKKTQEEIKSAILIYAVLQDAFKQIPVQIQSRLRPRIRKETSGLLNEVTEGKYPFIDLEKDYSLTVYYDGNYYPISRFSGGEKDLINVCLRVGISRVLVSLSAQKSFARVQSLFLDECFGSFDMERRRNLLAALNQLRKYFAQIVLITHIEEIKEALPEAFLVEELEDGSSIIKKVK